MSDRLGFPRPKQGVRLVAELPGGRLQLVAVVEAVRESGEVLLDCRHAPSAAALTRGLAISLDYCREDCVCELRSSITAIDLESPDNARVARVTLAAVSQVKRIQRRRAERAELALAARFLILETSVPGDRQFLLTKSHAAKLQKSARARGLVAETEIVSASGVRLRTEAAVARGDELYIELALPARTLCAIGRVVWSGQSRSNNAGLLLGVEYVAIADTDARALAELVSGAAGH